jgi:hypothetical protein
MMFVAEKRYGLAEPRAVRQRAWHRIVSVTIHAKLPASSRWVFRSIVTSDSGLS